MIARSCLQWRTVQPIRRPPRTSTPLRITAARNFHASNRLFDDFPNHYETLGLKPDAGPGEIKKQFYKLSKSHHPDLHPNDPEASQRFVKISEAYATLGSAEKKSRYDRDFNRAFAPSSSSSSSGPAHPSGSYSSASTPAGGRPASGLSRRRTQFRGPPPSFYRSGGWGAHGEKRQAAANEASHARHETAGPDATTDRTGEAAGTGPGGFAQGFQNDVPHFDHRGHYQTHSEIERTRHRARRKTEQQIRMEEAEAEAARVRGSGGGGGGMGEIGSFFMVSGVIVGIMLVAATIGGMSSLSDPRRRTLQKNEE